MRSAICVLLLTVGVAAQATPPATLDTNDRVRVREFYRLAAAIQDKVWPRWSATPAPLLLVTEDREFLTHHPHPPQRFERIDAEWYARPRQFPPSLLATFPAFGPPDVIVIGRAEKTDAKMSTPWVITLMHEHFHQFQDARPGLYDAVDALGLARGDQTGMWMLNYPFPYDRPELVKSFAELRDLLLRAFNEKDPQRFRALAADYTAARRAFFAQLAPDDAKYLSFQLWKEGVARYAQVRSAEAAESYKPSREYQRLRDYESFATYAQHARSDTLAELKRVDLKQWKRVAVYSWGAAEGLLLDRTNPTWKDQYFENLFTLDPYFETAVRE
jgi:hypothetical protein